MATELMTIPDINGDPEEVAKPNPNGRAAAADSRPTVWSNEDLAAVNALGTKLDNLAGFVDGLETLVGATNTALGTIAGYVDTVETLLGSANTLSTTLNGYVDGIEGLIGTTNTSLTTLAGYVDQLEGYVDGMEALATSTNTKLDTLHTDMQAGTVGTGIPGTPNTTTVLSVQGPSDAATPLRAVNPCDVVSFTPTLDTNIYASGDVLFDSVAVTIFRANDQRALLTSISVTDKSDQKPALKLLFFSSNVSLGTFNAAPSISDANAVNFLGSVPIAAADYDDLGGVSVAGAKNIGLMLESVSGAQTVYVAAFLTAGTPTFANGDIVIRLGVVQS